jgi:hypothetical protein
VLVIGHVTVAWWMAAFTELHAAVRSAGVQRTGPDGALFPNEFFELDDAELVALHGRLCGIGH